MLHRGVKQDGINDIPLPNTTLYGQWGANEYVTLIDANDAGSRVSVEPRHAIKVFSLSIIASLQTDSRIGKISSGHEYL